LNPTRPSEHFSGELVDLLLEVLADALDARERPLAGKRRLRPVVRLQLLFVGPLDALDGTLRVNRISLPVRT
jgi:hypothetical protein